jgi:D-aspartate ligase
MGGIEFKRDVRTRQFLMIEPTIGRVDGQEEVATLHGVNIPLAAYLHEIGTPIAQAEEVTPSIVWRDFISHWRSVYANRSRLTANPNTRFCGAYWRLADPMPAFFHFLGESSRSLRRIVSRVGAARGF